ncbi:hypothetical protein [Spirosoma luteum]|uniref:hypothetical protein n=1 Tax=Spirosoma luteum TaxID=431553 RepID=UPI00035F6D03|nr:hypothetical protein [Spirosoma luteum]
MKYILFIVTIAMPFSTMAQMAKIADINVAFTKAVVREKDGMHYELTDAKGQDGIVLSEFSIATLGNGSQKIVKFSFYNWIVVNVIREKREVSSTVSLGDTKITLDGYALIPDPKVRKLLKMGSNQNCKVRAFLYWDRKTSCTAAIFGFDNQKNQKHNILCFFRNNNMYSSYLSR